MPATAFVESGAPAYIPGGVCELFAEERPHRTLEGVAKVAARVLAKQIREVSPSGWGVIWSTFQDSPVRLAAREYVYATPDGRLICYSGGPDGGYGATGGVVLEHPAERMLAAEVSPPASRQLAARLDGYVCPRGTRDEDSARLHALMLALAAEHREKGWPVPSWMTERPSCLPAV